MSTGLNSYCQILVQNGKQLREGEKEWSDGEGRQTFNNSHRKTQKAPVRPLDL